MVVSRSADMNTLNNLSYSTVHLFFFNDPATTEIYTLSLHDALPISPAPGPEGVVRVLTYHTEEGHEVVHVLGRSEEHTSELQSRFDLVCRLLLEKKKTHPCT